MTDEPVSPLEVRVTRLEGLCEPIDRRLGALKTRFDSGFADLRAEIRASRSKTDAKLGRLYPRIDGLSTKIDKLEAKISTPAEITSTIVRFGKGDSEL